MSTIIRPAFEQVKTLVTFIHKLVDAFFGNHKGWFQIILKV